MRWRYRPEVPGGSVGCGSEVSGSLVSGSLVVGAIVVGAIVVGDDRVVVVSGVVVVVVFARVVTTAVVSGMVVVVVVRPGGLVVAVGAWVVDVGAVKSGGAGSRTVAAGTVGTMGRTLVGAAGWSPGRIGRLVDLVDVGSVVGTPCVVDTPIDPAVVATVEGVTASRSARDDGFRWPATTW